MLRSRRHLDAAAALEAEGVLDVDWPWSFAGCVVLDVQQARWDEAIRTYEQGSPEFGPGLRLLSRNHAATSALDVPLHRQDVETARRLAADVVDIGGSGAYARGLAQAVVDRLSGRPDAAIERLDALVAGASRLPMRGVALLAHLAYAHEDSGGRDQARQALDQRGDLAAGQDSAYAHALVNLLEARFRDDIDAARAGAETAAANGLVQYEAACRLELGRLGVDPAPNLLAAHGVFRSVGATGYTTAAEAEMRRHGVRAPTRRRRDPWALSDAEQRVVTLVAEGLTNRAIAERLSYSVKTIEAYLSRVYAKTGCANRVELVNHLAERERVTSASSIRPSR
jgi:DNA-binding CsgD family transcriptional regulator